MSICSQQKADKIDSFSGIFRFLSNFYSAPVYYEGITYPTSEHAFQAVKTVDENQRLNVAMLETPGEAKKYGKTVRLRPAWDDVRVGVMGEIVEAKFKQNPKLLEKLLATGDIELVEGNTWNDTFWGVCDGKGENYLGKVLMEVRHRLNTNTEDTDNEESNS
jgi:ribA/ribD-fused uncharacterized protein